MVVETTKLIARERLPFLSTYPELGWSLKLVLEESQRRGADFQPTLNWDGR